MYDQVKKNKYGYYELKDKPTSEELEKYYADKYYQESKGAYQRSYTEDEITYIKNRLERKFSIISKLLSSNERTNNFLDIGCGEGWALKHFIGKKWDVTGLDYSTYGCEIMNPDCLKNVIPGDIYQNIDKLINNRLKFDVILLDNVLEHVIDPEILLQYLKVILDTNGILIIEVPNDFSILQKYLLEKKYITDHFWIVSPDHISYFNKEGLINLCDKAGLKLQFLSTDYPIDLNLFNQDTNYINNKLKGKSVHKSRIEIENLLNRIDIDKTNELYSEFADLGLGRNIIAYLKKDN